MTEAVYNAKDISGINTVGTADNTTVVQNFINSMSSTGNAKNVIHFPEGIYRFDNTLYLPEGVFIQGDGHPAGTGYSGYTNFKLNHSNVGIHINTNTGARGITGVQFERSQPAMGGGTFTPTSHNFDIVIEGGQDVTLEKNHHLNSTNAIKVLGNASNGAVSGRIHMREITGNPFTTGIDLTHCLDVVYLDDIHWWPWGGTGTGVVNWLRNNMKAYRFGRVDNPKIGRIFCWGARMGMEFYYQGASGSLPTGRASLVHVSNGGFDNVTQGVFVDPLADGVIVKFDNVYAACDPGLGGRSALPLFESQGDDARIIADFLYGQNGDGGLVKVTGTSKAVMGYSMSSGMAGAEYYAGPNARITMMNYPEISSATHYGGTGKIDINEYRASSTTVTATAGAISASGTVRYRQRDNIVDFQAVIDISNAMGITTGAIHFTLPWQANADRYIANGREVAVHGKTLHGTIVPSSTICEVLNYDNSFPGQTGAKLVINGCYEAQ